MTRRREGAAVERESAVERYLELRPAVLARMTASVPDELRAECKSVTAHQLRALGLLTTGGLTMHELAGKLGVSGATASVLADRLVAHGLAERDDDPSDRRVVRLVPTGSGASLAARHREGQRRSVKALLERLSDGQVAAWLEIMETLAADDEARPPAPAPAELAGARR
ncbi:MAG: MarR family transcriptional regulator [Acidimicrobiales bacterium]